MRRKGTDQKGQLPSAPAAVKAGGVSRREWILISAVLVVGIGLRLTALSNSAVEHFDEGVYASNIYFGAPDYSYPQQRFYAPPLLPALIEAGMIVGLPPNVAALLPGFLAGCATILAVWWFGRSWFGPEVGIAAATLAALSDFHVMYSAAALTDVLLGLWIVLAVDAIARSLLAGDIRWAIGGGIYTGLAWWTKYNGWLPLAIEAAALPVLWLVVRPAQRDLLRWLACFAITVVVAALIWTPYYLSLQSQGGYGPIAANHAKYVVGLSGWADAAVRQISNHYVMERLLSPISVGLACALPGLLPGSSSWERIWRGGTCVVLVGVALCWSSFVLVGIAAVVGIVRLFGALMRPPSGSMPPQRGLVGLACVAVWFGGLLAVTPLYAPYSRLTLPWILVAWIGAGLNLGSPVADWTLTDLGVVARRWQNLLLIVALGGLCVVPALLFPQEFDFSRPVEVDRRGIQRVADRIQDSREGSEARAVYVFGEPGMFFQLRAGGEEHVAPAAQLPRETATIDGRPIPTFLVVGPHAGRDEALLRQWTEAQSNWQLVEEFDYRPSALVWLDLNDPRQKASQTRNTTVRLYRFQGAD